MRKPINAVMWPFFGLGAIYLGLEIVGVHGTGQAVLKGTLMPALLLGAVITLRSRTPVLMVVGLIAATTGDVLLTFDSDVLFLLGMLGFLVMQICYIIGFVRLGAWHKVRARWWILVIYAIVWVATNAVVAPAAGALAVPIAVYSLSLVAMAAVSAGVSTRVGIGGLLFLISDALIGLGLADLDFEGRGSVVMATYLVAQYLIITGWTRRVLAEP